MKISSEEAHENNALKGDLGHTREAHRVLRLPRLDRRPDALHDGHPECVPGPRGKDGVADEDPVLARPWLRMSGFGGRL
jgi:hypothetical protein